MGYANTTADNLEVRALSASEVEEVSAGIAPLVVLGYIGGAAAAGVVGTFAVGFVDGLIQGFQED